MARGGDDYGSKIIVLGLIAALAMPTGSARASHLVSADAEAHADPRLHLANVFSDDPKTVHDPRHPQTQDGPNKVFAPIGLIATNHPVIHQKDFRKRASLDMGTGFLVSPCYVMSAYHVVFGNRFIDPEPDHDYSTTFTVLGLKARALPVKYGAFRKSESGDWVLLRLESDAAHPCLGENPNIGWARLSALTGDDAVQKKLSTAGYPSDKPVSDLWRQDECRFYERLSGRGLGGLWTTDCPTRSRASGSPIFFVQAGLINVVAVMHGHAQGDDDPAIMPKWDPNRANLAVDIGDIIASDPEIAALIDLDIARFARPNPAQVSQRNPPK